MPLFLYTAMDASGKEKKGKIDAAAEDAAAAELKKQGLFITMIKPAKGAPKEKQQAAAARIYQRNQKRLLRCLLSDDCTERIIKSFHNIPFYASRLSTCDQSSSPSSKGRRRIRCGKAR